MFKLSEYRTAALLYVARNQNLIEYPLIFTEENLLEIVKKGDPIVVNMLEQYFKKREEWLNNYNEFIKRGTLTYNEVLKISELNASCDEAIKEIEDYIKSLI